MESTLGSFWRREGRRGRMRDDEHSKLSGSRMCKERIHKVRLDKNHQEADSKEKEKEM